MLQAAFTELPYGGILITVKSAYSKWSRGINLKATALQKLDKVFEIKSVSIY